VLKNSRKKNLWISIDRYGIMRPTKNISVGKFSSEKTDRISGVDVENSQLPTKDFLHWKTKSQWLHWDLNPWIWSSSNEGIKYKWEEDFIQENNGSGNDGEPKIQGLFNFVDNKVGDGGFCCVAGFNRVIKEYSAKTANSGYAKAHAKEYAFVEVHAADPLQKQVLPISLRAGSCLIWSSELPHCNYPNDSEKFRIVQYVKMFSSKEEFPGTVNRRKEVTRMIEKENVQLSDLGSKLLGTQHW